MQCNEIREMLSSYIDDVLDPADRASVEQHIGLCGACRQELADLKETIRLVSSLGEELPPEGFREQLMNKLKQEPVPVKSELAGKAAVGRFGRWTGWFSGSQKYAAAAVIIVGLGISMGIYQLNQTDMHLYGMKDEAPVESVKEAENNSTQAARNEVVRDGQKNMMVGRTDLQYKASYDSAVSDKADQYSSLSAPDVAMRTKEKLDGNPESARMDANTESAKLDTNTESAKMGVMEAKTQTPSAKKIIKDASLNMEVGNYKNFGSKLTVLAEQHGGYIENSSESLESAVSANFVIRVPNSQFAALVSALEKLGKVNGKNITGRDVTSEFIDTESRLRNLRTQETRLLNLMEKTSSLSDIVTLENELTRIRGDIENLQGRLKALDDTVVYSTIRLEVTETVKVKVNPPQGVIGKAVDNFKESLAVMINFMGNILKLTGWLLPWALVIGGTGGLLLYYRLVKKKKDE